MTDGRKRTPTTSVIAALGITTLVGSVLVASPSFAEPDIEDVEVRVDRLYHEAEQASERFNEVRIELRDSRGRLQSLRADLARQERKVETIRDQVAATVLSQYQGQATLSSTSRVLLSEDPDAFLSQLVTVSAYNDQRAEMMNAFATEVDELETREASAQREVEKIAEAKQTLADEKAEIDEKAGDAQELLDELEAEERARLEAAEERRERRAAAAAAASRSDDRAPVTDEAAPAPDAAPAPVPASGGAAAAVDFAMAQVGDAYVYGAAGPDAWDCSGLTMAAWGAAGVSLPHSSSAQMSSGTSVSASELQPGDLVFYYSPVSHVGMYIGNGQLVHAANPSSPVEVVPVDSMPISGAVRPG